MKNSDDRTDLHSKVLLAMALVLTRESRDAMVWSSTRNMTPSTVKYSRRVIARYYRMERSMYGSLAISESVECLEIRSVQ